MFYLILHYNLLLSLNVLDMFVILHYHLMVSETLVIIKE